MFYIGASMDSLMIPPSLGASMDSWMIPPSLGARMDSEQLSEQNRYGDAFIKSMMGLLHNQAYQDVELKCSDGTVNANKLLLASQSDFFKGLVDFENLKSEQEKKVVDLGQFSSDLVQVVVDNLIQLDFEKIASVDCLKLLEISDYLQMSALKLVASTRIAKELDTENVMDILKIAKDSNNSQLKNSCILFVEEHIFEVNEQKRLAELDKADLDKMIQDQVTKIRTELGDFEDSIFFVKNFYKLMKDLDRIKEFKKFIHLKHYYHDVFGHISIQGISIRDIIYFALTSDNSIFSLEEGEGIELTEKMKIDPKSEVGEFLAPMCPKPEGICYPSGMGLATHFWTDKYGDLSTHNLEFGPEWEVNGAFKKIKFYNTPVDGIAKILCGLEITLDDDTIHRVGYTDSPNVEEFDLEYRKISRLGICVSEETQLILAIQVNFEASAHFFPHNQHDFPFEGNGLEGLPPNFGVGMQGNMNLFGNVYTQKFINICEAILRRDYRFNGLKGRTALIDGRAIICEVQCKYLRVEESWPPKFRPRIIGFGINEDNDEDEMIEEMSDPDDEMDNMPEIPFIL